MPPEYQAINFQQKLHLFDQQWQPHIVAKMNDYEFKLVKIEGEFIWHSHADTDEAFIVIEGQLDLAFRDGVVSLGPGELYVVPKGVEHRPIASTGCKLLLIEPENVPNTGDQGGERTGKLGVWI